MYEKVILWATPAFFLLIAIEALVAARQRRSPYRLADAINSIGLGKLSTYVGVFTRLMTLGVYVAVFRLARVVTLDAGSPWVWAAGLVLYDFLYYWNHRLGHEVNVLWAAHVVHHQSEEFNLSTALRQTGSGFLLSWVFYLPMAVLGFPPELFLVVGLIDLLYPFWIHTDQIGSLGLIDRLLASPSNHRVHHAINDLYLDRNYGGILILWDRLFGTFQPELPAVPVVYGTRDPLRSWDPVWANLHTYAGLLRDSWYAHAWGDKLRVWVMHPGWRPDDVAARFPKAPFEPGAKPKFAPPLPPALAAYCFVQAVLVLAFGTRFLALVPGLALWPALGWLAWLVLSLWVVGGLTEARPVFRWLEMIRLATLVVALALLARAGGASMPAVFAAATIAVLLGSWLVWASRRLTPVAVHGAPA